MRTHRLVSLPRKSELRFRRRRFREPEKNERNRKESDMKFRKKSLRILAIAALAASGLSVAARVRAADAPDDASRKININQASATQLALLPRVGAKAAERIVEYRKSHGPFNRAEELMEVKGVGEKLFTELKPYVVTTGATTLASKVRAGARGPRSGKKSGSAAASGSSGKKTASSSVPVGKGR
jgi:competence protein ComEA